MRFAVTAAAGKVSSQWPPTAAAIYAASLNLEAVEEEPDYGADASAVNVDQEEGKPDTPQKAAFRSVVVPKFSRQLKNLPRHPAEAASSEGECESLSDISDDSDLFNAETLDADSMTWCTEQDEDIYRARLLASQLREHPLLPPDPVDQYQEWRSTQEGVNFPAAHCAFAGCDWTQDSAQNYLLNLPVILPLVKHE